MKLGLTDDEINILNMSVKKRDYYYKSTAGSRLFQLNLGPIELALFRGKETAFKMPDENGNINIVSWNSFQQYLLSQRKPDERPRKEVDRILDIQGIEFRHYLKDYEWENFL